MRLSMSSRPLASTKYSCNSCRYGAWCLFLLFSLRVCWCVRDFMHTRIWWSTWTPFWTSFPTPLLSLQNQAKKKSLMEAT